MVSFFVNEEKIDLKEADEIMKLMEQVKDEWVWMFDVWCLMFDVWCLMFDVW
jgi:hypothetical protein